MLGSALGYSTLGVLYDLLIRTEQPPPSHAEIMRYTSCIGAHQLILMIPNRLSPMCNWTMFTVVFEFPPLAASPATTPLLPWDELFRNISVDLWRYHASSN